jgi:hypothetical protein
MRTQRTSPTITQGARKKHLGYGLGWLNLGFFWAGLVFFRERAYYFSHQLAGPGRGRCSHGGDMTRPPRTTALISAVDVIRNYLLLLSPLRVEAARESEGRAPPGFLNT